MFKKNSWIVALLLALTLTALFTGCIDALAEEEAGVTYTEVELGDFNIWGGQNYQRGWAVGGMKFLGVGDKDTIAEDKGYKNEDFAKATKLVIEMEDATHPNGALDIIWGAADANGDSVGQDWIQTGAIKSSKEGNILTIDLTAMKDYGKYKTGDYAMRKLILQAGGEKAGLPFVKKAKLLIPDIVEPFIEVTDLTIKKSTAIMSKDFVINGVVAPENASKQTIIWSIVGFLPKGQTDTAANWLKIDASTPALYASTKAALLAKANFKAGTKVVTPATSDETTLDYSVLPPEEKVIKAGTPAQTIPWPINGTLVGTAEGKVKVTATIIGGGKDEEDYTKDFVIDVIDPIALNFKVNGSSVNTKEWMGAANGGVDDTEMVVASDGNSFTVEYAGGYGNSYFYIEIDFGDYDQLGSYNGIKFNYKGLSGDFNHKDIRVMASTNAETPTGYNPGTRIATTENSGDVSSTAKAFDVAIGSGTASELGDLAFAKKIYFWIVPWGNPMKFEVSGIEFYKTPLQYKVDTTDKTTINFAGQANGPADEHGSAMKSDGNGYTITMTGNGYGNAYSYFEVDFGSENIGDFTGVKFKYTGVSGDMNNKTIRVKASLTKPASTYNPGSDVSRLDTGDALAGVSLDAVFGANGATADSGFATNITTLSAQSKIYLWFLPWSDISPTVFKITDIEFYK